MVGRVDLVGITERSCAVELDEDHSRRIVGHPEIVKCRPGRHPAADRGEPGPVAANVNPERIASIRLTGEITRQDHPRRR